MGPRNLQKLVGGGLWDLAQLKQLYRDKVCGVSCPVSLFVQCQSGNLTEGLGSRSVGWCWNCGRLLEWGGRGITSCGNMIKASCTESFN